MKIGLFSVFLTLILASNLLLSNTFAQDYTQWELPEGAIARLGKGGIRKIQYSPDNRFLAAVMALSASGTHTLESRKKHSQKVSTGLRVSRSARMGEHWRVGVATAQYFCGDCVNTG